jgi:hypothetical protein
MPGELQIIQWLVSLADEAPLLAALAFVVILWRRDYLNIIKKLDAKADYVQQLLERAITAIEKNSNATNNSTETLRDLSDIIESIKNGNPPFPNRRSSRS